MGLRLLFLIFPLVAFWERSMAAEGHIADKVLKALTVARGNGYVVRRNVLIEKRRRVLFDVLKLPVTDDLSMMQKIVLTAWKDNCKLFTRIIKSIEACEHYAEASVMKHEPDPVRFAADLKKRYGGKLVIFAMECLWKHDRWAQWRTLAMIEIMKSYAKDDILVPIVSRLATEENQIIRESLLKLFVMKGGNKTLKHLKMLAHKVKITSEIILDCAITIQDKLDKPKKKPANFETIPVLTRPSIGPESFTEGKRPAASSQFKTFIKEREKGQKAFDLMVAEKLGEAIKVKDIDTIKKILEKPLPKSLLAPIEINSPDVRTGRRLPDTCIMPKEISSIEVDIIDNEIWQNWDLRYIKTAKEYFAMERLQGAITALCFVNDPTGVKWLARRADVLPPTRLDVCVYWICFGSFKLIFKGKPKKDFEQIFTAGLPCWRKMLRGKNPIYRFISLQCVRYFETDDNILRAYEQALMERNTIFQVEAIKGLSILAAKGVQNAQVLIRNYLTLKENDGTWIKGKSVITLAKDKLRIIKEQVTTPK